MTALLRIASGMPDPASYLKLAEPALILDFIDYVLEPPYSVSVFCLTGYGIIKLKQLYIEHVYPYRAPY